MLFSASFVRCSYTHIPKPCGCGAVTCAHHLLRLAFAAVRGAPQRPLIARADGVHRIPEFCRDAGIRSILQHASALTTDDLPANLAAELEVVTLVVDRPGAVRLHVDAALGGSDQLLQRERRGSRQDTDVRHANDRQPVPAFCTQTA